MALRLAWIGLLLCGALGLGSCETEVGRAPVARIEITPEYIPLHDGYTTVVALDGTKSKDEIDDPAGTRTLGFRWQIDDRALQVVEGSLDSAQVRVKLQGERPTTVTLMVWDWSGRTGTRTSYVGVSVEAPDGGAGAEDATTD